MTRKALAVLSLCGAAFWTISPSAPAQLSSANAAGVAMGHVHFVVRDVEAHRAFWQGLGGEPVMLFGRTPGFKFPDVVVLLREGEPSGTSEDAVVNHVAFRVKSLAEIEAKGYQLTRNDQFPGVAYVYTPENEKIELFDDELATNLGFTVDGGGTNPVAERHNRKIEVPIIAHHIHLYVPQGQIPAAKAWYAEHFGGVPGMRWRYDAVDFPGINLNFSETDREMAPTQGRMLDHIGFEIENLEEFCRQLEAKGIKLDRPYQKLESGFGLAFLTDPWGTYIELTEGLREL